MSAELVDGLARRTADPGGQLDGVAEQLLVDPWLRAVPRGHQVEQLGGCVHQVARLLVHQRELPLHAEGRLAGVGELDGHQLIVPRSSERLRIRARRPRRVDRGDDGRAWSRGVTACTTSPPRLPFDLQGDGLPTDRPASTVAVGEVERRGVEAVPRTARVPGSRGRACSQPLGSRRLGRPVSARLGLGRGVGLGVGFGVGFGVGSASRACDFGAGLRRGLRRAPWCSCAASGRLRLGRLGLGRLGLGRGRRRGHGEHAGLVAGLERQHQLRRSSRSGCSGRLRGPCQPGRRDCRRRRTGRRAEPRALSSMSSGFFVPSPSPSRATERQVCGRNCIWPDGAVPDLVAGPARRCRSRGWPRTGRRR